MAAHTPGPWTLSARHDRDGRRVVEEARGYALARVCPMASSPLSGPQYFEQDANARLIAAAPELLAVARAIVGALDDTTFDVFIGTPPALQRLTDCRSAAVAAIAKATGG